MFLNQEEKEENLNKYIKQEWIGLSPFTDSLKSEEDVLLIGYGFFNHQTTGQFAEKISYHLLKMNDRLFGFCCNGKDGEEPSEGSNLIFKYINEFDNDLLNSSFFTHNSFRENKNYYKNFESELPVENKLYQYQDEEKLLISKEGIGNIDLYISYQVKNITNEFTVKIQPNVFSTAKHLAMKKLLDERIKNLKK